MESVGFCRMIVESLGILAAARSVETAGACRSLQNSENLDEATG